MQQQNAKPIELVISRKSSLADLARRGITTLEQLASLSVEEMQSVAGIGEKTAPQVKALAHAYLKDNPIRFGDLSPEVGEHGAFLDVRVDTIGQLSIYQGQSNKKRLVLREKSAVYR